MMLGVVASNGKRKHPYWFPQGLKITTQVCLDVLQTVVKPWINETFSYGGFELVLQQDSDPGHKSKMVQQRCESNFENFNFWPWGSDRHLSWTSHQLTMLFVESRCCATPHSNMDTLKAPVEVQWTNMPYE